MPENRVTRRQFVRDTALGAAALAAGISSGSIVEVGNAAGTETSGILNYTPEMEYRRCGKTEWMISSVCLGGHWKRVNEMVPGLFNGESWLSANLGDPAFQQNRYDVVSRCIERGINYIDACTGAEIIAYSKALQGRRDRMHLGWSWYEREARNRASCSGDALIKVFEDSLLEAKQEYVDLYRIVCGVDGRQGENGEWIFPHTLAESEGIAEGLDRAKKSGKARMTGISSHDRPWLKYMMETFPDQIDVVITPYTAKTKALPDDPTGFFAALKHCDCGFFGIKPFAGKSAPGRGRPHRPAGDSLHPLQPRDHGPDSRHDQPRTGRQRGPGGDAKTPVGQGRTGRTRSGHGPGLGQPPLPLSLAQRLGVDLAGCVKRSEMPRYAKRTKM
jgi:aryl-alcohol dehydrogenase-like predicted oxidoreductase